LSVIEKIFVIVQRQIYIQ